jgi:hypothetical protein
MISTSRKMRVALVFATVATIATGAPASTREISEDGKSYTFTTEGKNAKGESFKNVAVYDRQEKP